MWEPLQSVSGIANLFKIIEFEQLNKDYYIFTLFISL